MAKSGTRSRVAFLVNGRTELPVVPRAKVFAERLGDHFDIVIGYRDQLRLKAIKSFVNFLGFARPDATYVIDMAYAGVIAAGICRSLVTSSSGTATRMLRARAVGYGVADRIDFIPQIPYDSIGEYLSAIHICFSTQTNDVPGNMRTTGKLSLNLAAGRYILASDVGEAARVLPASKLESYQGTVDRAYFGRMLSARVPHPGDAAVSSNTPEVQ